MPLRVNHNIPSLNVQRLGHINNRNLALHLERLSSGMRINRAADDASGLSVSEGMRAEISGLQQGAKNTEQAVNLVQTAEGALNEVNAMLIRMRELAVQSASSTVNNGNRQSINAEFVQLSDEIDRIARVTTYNNSTLLSGYGNRPDLDPTVSTALASATTGVANLQLSSASAGTYVFIDSTSDNALTLGNGVATQTINLGPALDADGAASSGVVATGSAIVANFDRLGVAVTLSGQHSAQGPQPATDGYRDGDLNGTQIVVNAGTGGIFQIGANAGADNRLEVNIGDMRASGSNLSLSGVSLSSLESARSAISTIDLAINKVAQTRGDLGAFQNRLSHSLNSVENAVENNQASESSIRDADMAAEVSGFTQSQILSQASTSLLAQANTLPQSALTLLR